MHQQHPFNIEFEFIFIKQNKLIKHFGSHEMISIGV